MNQYSVVGASKGGEEPSMSIIPSYLERKSSWQAKLAHNKLVWCTQRVGRVIDYWVAFSDVVIIARRLAREGWSR